MFDVYFAPPRTGKTTFACALVSKMNKKFRKDPDYHVYSNVPISGAMLVSKSDIGQFLISDGLLIIDEAGVDFNNRDFKSFGDDRTKFFKYHGHFCLDVAVFSQSYNDMDKKLRDLATRMWLLRRHPLLPIVVAIRIRKKIGINEFTKEICDEYYFDGPIMRLFTSKRIWAPAYYKMFNSYDRYDLPVKDFPICK